MKVLHKKIILTIVTVVICAFVIILNIVFFSNSDYLSKNGDKDWWELELNESINRTTEKAVPVTFAEDGAYTWWTNSLAIRYVDNKDATYVSYVSEKGEMTVTSLDHNTGDYSRAVLATFEQDDHNSAALSILPDSKLIAVYARHNMDSYLRWRITEEQEDINTFGEEKKIVCGGAITYIQMHRIDKYKYRVFYRYNLSNWATRVYDYESDTWTEEIVWLVEPYKGQYYIWTQADKEFGKINVFMTCHPNNGTDQNIRYGYFDKDSNICVMGGKIIGNLNKKATNTLTPRDFDIAYEELDPAGQTRLFDVTYKGEKLGCLFGTFKGTNDCIYRYCYYDDTNGKWVTESITEAGRSQGNKSYYAGVSFDKKDMQTVYVARESKEEWYLEKWVTEDFGKTWSSTLIDKTTRVEKKILFRPIVPYNSHDDIDVLYLKGKYPTYLTFDTDIMSYGD